MTTEIERTLNRIEKHLAHIAEALDADRAAPNYRNTLAAYPGYVWADINASVVASDDHGATRVMWHRHIYTRRSNPKYGRGVWFSRGAGRDDAGEQIYQRLCTFAPPSPVEPLPASIRDSIHQAPAPAAKKEPGELERYFPREGEQPKESQETPRERFFKLLPVAIAAGLTPDIANSLTALGRRTGYPEALTTLEQHVEQLEARTV
ncbi:hypothetical protein ES705_34414 [subsurface metagenome]